MARTSARTRPSKKGAPESALSPKRFDIPYFAHMQLDPTHFPEGEFPVLAAFAQTTELGAPVGRPPFKVLPYGAVGEGCAAWEDSDDAASDELDDDLVPIPPRTASKASSSKPLSGSAYKKLKVDGGRPAVAKKVTANLDSDDELIVRMKNAKYLEKDIAATLAKEGRINYHPKTIGTRWARIKKMLQRVQDEMLDDELTDWHEGDDDVLRKAIEKADADVEKAKKDADEKKWRIVADQMKVLKPVINFSQNACRDRFEALQAGTAKPTPESVPNPDEGTLARIQSRHDKEWKIRDDAHSIAPNTDNIEGNAWTSRMRTYY